MTFPKAVRGWCLRVLSIQTDTNKVLLQKVARVLIGNHECSDCQSFAEHRPQALVLFSLVRILDGGCGFVAGRDPDLYRQESSFDPGQWLRLSRI